MLLSLTEEEFRSQEPEFRMNSVRLVDESWFKAPGFIRGDKETKFFMETPDFRHWVILTPDD